MLCLELVCVPIGIWVSLLRACLLRWLMCWTLAYKPQPGPWVPPRPVARLVAGAADDCAARRHPRRKPDWMRREVVRLAVFLPSVRTVAAAFNAIHRQRGYAGHTWVHEVMREHRDLIALRRRAMRAAPPPVVPVRQRWSLDLTYVPRGDGQHDTVLGIIDQGSRAVLSLKVLAHKHTWALLAQLCQTIRYHGRPDVIRTDNEGMFDSRLWAVALGLVGIRHQRSAPRCPWQNGRIERFFGTLKPLLRQLTLPTTACLQNALDEVAGFYNHVRVHQALGGLTPAQAWRGIPLADVRRARQGRWVQALDGRLIGYHLRC